MASFTVPCPKCSSFAQLKPAHQNQHNQPRKFAFGAPFNSRLSLISGSSFGDQQRNGKQSSVGKVQAQLNEVAVEKSSNSALVFKPKSGPTSSDLKEEFTEKTMPDASSISEFMAQVADLVKLVDSRDITELQLKNLDLEVTIRKKEALLPPPSAAPYAAVQHPVQHAYQPPPPALALPPATPAAAPAPAALPAPPKASTSSHPPLKCPMAGTFYRSPGPGEPPFVKVGDKVQKGQVICIIEAMKLMNEIEADQSGTLVEVLTEDGKPVSVDTPLFVIAP